VHDACAALASTLGRELGGRWTARALGASGFCATWQAASTDRLLFVKSAPAGADAALHAEADGLRGLAATAAIRVPAVAGLFTSDGAGTVLALEWLALRPPDAGFGERLGRALGALHALAVDPPRYGWPRDNFVGATPQCNAMHDDWIAFLAGRRLAAMRGRLDPRRDTALADATNAVIAALPAFFADGHVPRPSLIHGDLWSGNWGMLEDGAPVVWDPAVSWSDAEAELAMMELFGAPPPGFWAAYRDTAGLHPGYARRRGLYQLYHLLNHVVLFGGGYRAQALACARALLREA
jgi:fructosamine-3-kinase